MAMTSGIKLLTIAICALVCATDGASPGQGVFRDRRSLLQAPAPGPAPPCTCSIASIFTGVTYCFSVTDVPGSNAKRASPQCSVFTSAYTCGNTVTLAPAIQTNTYPNTTITGQGLQCNLTSFTYRGSLPAPALPPAPAGSPQCIELPASDYGPTGRIAYANGSDGRATPECTVADGQVCGFTFYLSGGPGSAKVCASQAAEDSLRG